MTSFHNHSMTSLSRLTGVLLGTAMLLNASAAMAQSAARVTFAAGNVSIVAANGSARQAQRNAEVNPGETVTTAVDSWAQLRFSDGAMTSLQPETGFKIDEYQFKGAADGSERGFFSLLKGALRTVTGAIGHGTDRNNYKITTATATIGIRGTEYLARLDNGLTVSVGDGRVALINDAGEFVLGPGQTGFVADSKTLPRLVIQKPVVSTPEPLREEPRFVAAEQRSAEGKSTAVTSDEHSSSSGGGGAGLEQFAVGIVATNGAAQMSQAGNYSGATTSDFQLVTSGTTLQKFRYSSMIGDIGSASALQTGTIGGLTYGRWSTPGATATGWGASTPWGVGSVTDPQVVYLFGNAATLPTTGTLSLSAAGGTSPVNTAGTTGTFNSGSMSLDFAGKTYSFSLNFSVAAATYVMTTAHQSFGSDGRIEGTNSFGTCTGGGCGGTSGLPAAWSGLIRPTAAGLVYGIQDNAGTNKTVTGVQVFQ
jgi:hypothetical protein